MIDEEDDSSEEEEEGEEHAVAFEGGYNPSDFENLAVSADIKELFQYISRYTPQTVSSDSCWILVNELGLFYYRR